MPMEPTREPRRSDPAAAIPFLERKLDELYQILRGARCANALIDARSRLEEHNYDEAFRLIRDARDAHARAPAKDWRKRAAQVFGEADPEKEMFARFTMVLNLIRRMSKSQKGAPKAVVYPAVARRRPAEPAAGDAPQSRPSGPGSEAGPAGEKSMVATALDMGAFSQLYTAAQQCGLLSNADVILSARDREYVKGHYQRALEMIEGLYAQLNVSAARRQQEMRQEETRFRAGTLKMSPKAWLLRQRRAMQQSQQIDRARRYFARVLDGLRVLRAASAK